MLLEGARVYVEGLPVGRTDGNGTLTGSVPSGPIRVQAEMPSTQWGEGEISLSAGQSGAIEITLDDDKEVDEHTTLVLDEALDDIIPVTTRSMTLKFVRDGRLAPATAIDDVEVVDRHDNTHANIENLFRVVRGAIVAADVRRVFDTLAPLLDGPIVLRVLATDAEGAMHHGRVAFRVARYPLSVTLEAPPSNPSLPVSDIEVGISLSGGFAVQRVSDAQGRFEISSFPEGVLDLECAIVYKGNYYYGDGIVDLTGPASVTLVLLNIVDIKNGVAPFRVDGGNRPSPRRKDR
jgi:hypothetical protein